jgi:hypothetical protein
MRSLDAFGVESDFSSFVLPSASSDSPAGSTYWNFATASSAAGLRRLIWFQRSGSILLISGVGSAACILKEEAATVADEARLPIEPAVC